MPAAYYLNAALGYYESADGMAIDPADQAVPQRPDSDWTWNATAGAWRLTIAAVRARVRDRITAAYRSANAADIAVPGLGTFGADDDARQALRDALLSGLPSVGLLDAADALTPLSAAQLLALMQALQARDSANRQRLAELREQIKVAATKPLLNALVW